MVLLTDEWVLVLINYGVVDDDTTRLAAGLQACSKSNTLPDIIATASVIATTTINGCIITNTT